jgi:hypothetical protein
MIAVLVIIALFGNEPRIRSQIVPADVCDMVAHQEIESLLTKNPEVGSAQYRCVNVVIKP